MQRTAKLAAHLSSSAVAAAAPKPVCVIVGAGDATGSALARKFSSEGYLVACARREGAKLEPLIRTLAPGSRGFSTDARLEAEVQSLFQVVEKEMGPISVVIHNIGGNVRFPVLETTERVYRKVWELCGLSAFLVGKEAAKHMVPRGKGTIVFTGATAATRGAANFAAFAGGMHAKRALAQTMAREFGPAGIHVAHVIVDGPIHTQFIREVVGADNFAALRESDGLLQPDEIAQAYFALVQQHRSAWTFEMDLRPYSETF